MDTPTYVPDGELCPRHGEPSRLLMGATGLFSQCSTCRTDFLDWYGSHTRDVRPSPTSSVSIEKEEDPGVPEWRQRQILEAQKRPRPAQGDLGL